MSAFMVSKAHLSAMAAAALKWRQGYGIGFSFYHRGKRYEFQAGDEAKIVAILHSANRRSILARYPNDFDFAGPAKPPAYERPRRSYSPTDILNAIACFEYQACEHKGWERSLAAALCEALRKAMIRDLPTDTVRWEISE